MRRLFIAINLPQKIKNQIIEAEKNLKDFYNALNESTRLRLIPEKNWHMTIAFLGSHPENSILKIKESMEAAVKNFNIPEIKINKIVPAPPDKINSPKMIWALFDEKSSQLLNELKKRLKTELSRMGINYKDDHRNFSGHITIARFNSISPQNYSEIKALIQKIPQFEALFLPKSLDLMESRLKKSGPEYTILFKVGIIGK